MKKERTLVIVNHRTLHGGYGSSFFKVQIDSDIEETFKKILNSLPKKVLKCWEVITFFHTNSKYEVRKDWLEETNYNFWQSVEIDKD